MRRLPLLLLLAVAASVPIVARSTPHCVECNRARLWMIPPDEFKRDDPEPTDFPESKLLRAARPADLGLAFSGGGTRSATATLGELRGLHHNGWLSEVTYISAISGGSWGSLPFVFSDEDEAALLGSFESPEQLRLATIDTPRGLLAAAIATSGLTGPSIPEALDLAEPAIPNDTFNNLYDKVRKALYGVDAERADKTYTRLLEKVFINKLVKSSSKVPFVWNRPHLKEITDIEQNTSVLKNGFFLPRSDRPFFIAGGTLIRPRAGFPQLIPVEYTPLYSGIRQQFGAGIGGSYVWSWAYDRPAVEIIGDHVLVKPAPDKGAFALADVIASSGAAPQLSLFVGALPALPEKVQQTASGYFPAFRQFSIQMRAPIPGYEYGRLGASEVYAHGDGGFVDYVGIMSLLARQVKNIVAFVNSDRDPKDEMSLLSYFQKVAQNGGGDRTHNVVFDTALGGRVVDDLNASVRAGGPPVACYSNWEVKPNDYYNIRPYKGLNICWVHNMRARGWMEALRDGVRNELFPEDKRELPKRAEAFVRFPQYHTFVEDKGRLIQLRADQINALANFTSWAVTDLRAICRMREHLKRPDGSPALPMPAHLPAGTTCAGVK